MDLQLSGQHVLITGGSKGIGFACAQGFLREGARVSLVARDAATLAKARDQLLLEFPNLNHDIGIYSADLKDPAAAKAAMDAAVALHGAVDVLVNSAGAAQRTPHDELSPAAWRAAMDAKFFTYIHMMDAVIKTMGARGQGAVVNVIGAGGKHASNIHLPGGAANAALMLASSGLATAYAPRGVRVNAVNPGQTQTERLQGGLAAMAKADGISVDAALARATQSVPLGRLAQPEEIANAVLFLASSKASYITGVVVAMDGASHPMVV
jgi:NAD(P)-dependent dehydrogenase (short-subunit alcohol dehydrogenase family)